MLFYKVYFRPMCCDLMPAGKISRVWHGYRFSVGLTLACTLATVTVLFDMLLDGYYSPEALFVAAVVATAMGGWLLGVYNARRYPHLGSEVSYG